MSPRVKRAADAYINELSKRYPDDGVLEKVWDQLTEEERVEVSRIVNEHDRCSGTEYWAG